jgi:hypothetical protein
MSNKYMTGDIVKCKDVCSDPSYNGIECRLSTENGDSNRWSNNSKNGNSLKEEDISHFIKRVDCNYKVGDVVKVKHFDTDMRHNIQLINGDMIKHKTVTITKVLGRDDFHTYQYKIEEDAYDWSDWMFEGLASECKENKQLSKEVLDIVNNFADPTEKYIGIAKEMIRQNGGCFGVACSCCPLGFTNNKNKISCNRGNPQFRKAVEEYVRRWEGKRKIHYTNIQYPCVITDIKGEAERIKNCSKAIKDMYIYANLDVCSISVRADKKVNTWCDKGQDFIKGFSIDIFYSYDDIDWEDKKVKLDSTTKFGIPLSMTIWDNLKNHNLCNISLGMPVYGSPNWMKEIIGRPTNKYGKKIRNVNRKKLLTEKDKELFTFKKKDYKIKRKKLSSEI